MNMNIFFISKWLIFQHIDKSEGQNGRETVVYVYSRTNVNQCSASILKWLFESEWNCLNFSDGKRRVNLVSACMEMSNAMRISFSAVEQKHSVNVDSSVSSVFMTRLFRRRKHSYRNARLDVTAQSQWHSCINNIKAMCLTFHVVAPEHG